jgi:hypothetical protein
MLVRCHLAILSAVAWALGLDRAGPGARERGFSTAESLAGAALAVIALVAIWGALRALGMDVVDWMRSQIIR